MSGLLDVRDVSYCYPGRSVLQSVNFSASGGEFVVLMGVNGAGKSTLLDILAGLRRPDSGNVIFGERNLESWSPRQRSRQISHLPQGIRYELPFSVEQMVLMGRYAFADRWFESDEDRAYAQDAMHRMDCLPFRDRLYSTLERWRTAKSAFGCLHRTMSPYDALRRALYLPRRSSTAPMLFNACRTRT